MIGSGYRKKVKVLASEEIIQANVQLNYLEIVIAMIKELLSYRYGTNIQIAVNKSQNLMIYYLLR